MLRDWEKGTRVDLGTCYEYSRGQDVVLGVWLAGVWLACCMALELDRWKGTRATLAMKLLL